MLQNDDYAVPPIASQATPAPPIAASAPESGPADAFDNPLSEGREEARDLVSDWELSQSIAVDFARLQVIALEIFVATCFRFINVHAPEPILIPREWICLQQETQSSHGGVGGQADSATAAASAAASAVAAAAAIAATSAPPREPSSRPSPPQEKLLFSAHTPPMQHPATQTPFRGLLPNPSMSPEISSPDKGRPDSSIPLNAKVRLAPGKHMIFCSMGMTYMFGRMAMGFGIETIQLLWGSHPADRVGHF